ncbi:MAG: putative membrane protein [Chloroflexi bacterium]|jgi:cytochrome c oxidase assembly factor CtaG|nr:MAG: putative membrane protein [Chloroflexota bacterium]
MNVAWWCSAQKATWTWAPQYYPGIWLVMLALLVGYIYAVRRVGPSKVALDEPVVTRSQVTSFGAGWVLLWLATDWPLGALGAGYLLTAHMIQYVAYSLVVAPLLLRGTPPWMRELVLNAPGLGPLRALTERPFLAFIAFNLVLAVSHLSFVSDTLKPIQFGQMFLDVIWLLIALAFWTAIGSFGDDEEHTLAHGKRLLCIIGMTVLPTIPGAFFVFSEFPIYTTYEFATRAFADFSARDDQVIAGLVMWVGMMPFLMVRLALAFFVWSQAESRRAGQI